MFTDGRTDIRKSGSLYRAMPEAGATKRAGKHTGSNIAPSNLNCKDTPAWEITYVEAFVSFLIEASSLRKESITITALSIFLR